jgi:DNA-binding PadR family transcriptional regulator
MSPSGRDTLGEFEQLLLLAIVRLGDEAYGVTIRREIEERTGRDVAIGALYTALDRLERKGFVRSVMSEPTAERGGRSKRHVRLKPAGATALKQSRERLARMWEGLAPDLKRDAWGARGPRGARS